LKTPTKIYGPATDRARPAYLGRDGTTAVDTDERLHRIQAGDTVVLDEVGLRLAGLARDQEIVAYCRGQYCVLARTPSVCSTPMA
jgi:hypothetical protein